MPQRAADTLRQGALGFQMWLGLQLGKLRGHPGTGDSWTSDTDSSQEFIFIPHPSTKGHPTVPSQESLYLAIDVIVLSKQQEASDEGCQERVHLVALALHMGL